MEIINEAHLTGARLSSCCKVLSLCLRRYQRWVRNGVEDQRHGPLGSPRNKLTEEERSAVIRIVKKEEFRDLTPWQIVPLLLDRGEYVASESSMYRILKHESLLCHRQKSKPPSKSKPTPLVAYSPNEVWSWDITFLKSLVRGQFYYLYLFMDIFSRYIVGGEVFEVESMELSSNLFSKICRDQMINPQGLHLHSDNGGSMKGATMLATLQRLGVVPSFSRPSVSDDNAFSESLFKTLKYCPWYPSGPFKSLDEARSWVKEFIYWYNEVHLHSGIKFVTPGSRYRGEDIEILRKRKQVYAIALAKTPHRWSLNTKNLEYINYVELNSLSGKVVTN